MCKCESQFPTIIHAHTSFGIMLIGVSAHQNIVVS